MAPRILRNSINLIEGETEEKRERGGTDCQQRVKAEQNRNCLQLFSVDGGGAWQVPFELGQKRVGNSRDAEVKMPNGSK